MSPVCFRPVPSSSRMELVCVSTNTPLINLGWSVDKEDPRYVISMTRSRKAG